MTRDVVTTYAVATARADELERENAKLRAALAAQPAQPVAVPADVMDAMRDALSVCQSVRIGRDRKISRDGDVFYLQTEEWCDWAFSEVATKVKEAIYTLAAAPAAPKREPLCACGDRAASKCDEQWGSDCDLGNNDAHVAVYEPQRLPLTDEQIDALIALPECWSSGGLGAQFYRSKFARAIERAHGITKEQQ